MSYYDIDTILMEEELVPCRASIAIVNLGFFDKQQQADHLREGTKLDLPVWLLQAVRSQHRTDGKDLDTLFKIDIPKQLTPPYLELLEADATVVNLYEWSAYFFEFAMAYFRLLDAEFAGAVSVTKALAQRYKVVAGLAQNSLKGDTMDKIRRLDNLERMLFGLGVKSDQQFQRWQRRRSHIINIVPGADRPPSKRTRISGSE